MNDQLPENTPEIIDSIANLIKVLVDSFGSLGTIFIFSALVLIPFGWRVYNNRRKDKEVNALLVEKDKTIQRLAEQERSYRALFFKTSTNWSDEEIESFVIKGEFRNPKDSRKYLEKQGIASLKNENDQ